MLASHNSLDSPLEQAIAEWARQPGHGRNQSEISDSTETTISSPSESDFIPPHDSPPVHAFSTDALFLRQDSHGSPPPPKILSIVPRLLLSQQHTQAVSATPLQLSQYQLDLSHSTLAATVSSTQ